MFSHQEGWMLTPADFGNISRLALQGPPGKIFVNGGMQILPNQRGGGSNIPHGDQVPKRFFDQTLGPIR